MFCLACQAAIDSVPLFDGPVPTGPQGLHYTYESTRSTSSIRNASSATCLVCSRLGNGLNGERLPNATEHPFMNLVFMFYLGNPFITGTTERNASKTTKGKGVWYWAKLQATYLQTSSWSSRVEFSSILFNNFVFRDVTGYNWAKNPYDPMRAVELWHKDCTTQHRKCNQMPADVSWSPTRLIKIGGTENENPRLIVTGNMGNLPFATLSHMWGDGQFLKLQRSNLVAFQEGIPLGELSPAFRYALSVCRELGLLYIWIDSLCIIQEEESLLDWTIEAPKMHEVYSNCVCNTALLTEQAAIEKVALRPSRLEDLVLADSEGVEMEDDLTQYTIIEPGYWEKEVEAQPLLSRAWVMQEILLAPRVLYLGDKELFWECRSIKRSMKYSGRIPYHPLDGNHLKTLVPSQMDVKSMDNLLKLWVDILERYSRCKLSHISDKLVAIAGIAKKFHEYGMGEYVAGLWQRDLESQLLWVSICPIADQKPSSNSYRGPSFSWVAIDNAMVGHFRGVRHESQDAKVNILHIQLERPGGMFGPVQGGFLQVCGKLKELKFLKEIAPHCLYQFSKYGGWEWIEPGDYSINGVISTHSYYELGVQIQPRIVVSLDRIDSERITQKLYCLTIFGVRVPPEENIPITTWMMKGLLLEPTRAKSGGFRRVGVFTAVGKQYDELFLGPHEMDASIPCDYDEASGKHKVTII